MAQASGSRVQLAYVAESTYGTTPGTPQTQLIEFVSFSGALNPEVLTDPTIRPDRQRSFARRGNVSTEGQIEVVLRPDNYDTLIEAALMGSWTANVLKVGSTFRSFSIEQGFNDLTQFRVFKGSVINTFGMNIPVNELVTATFGFQGANTTAFSGTTIDGTPTPVTAKDGFFHEGGNFIEGGSAAAFLSSISFELSNNLTTNYALGVLGARNVTAGTVGITGTVTALFEDVSFYNKFVAASNSSLSFTLTAGSPAETMTFLFPRVQYTQGTIPVQNDGPLQVEMQFEALFDDTEQTSLKITRSA